MKKTQKIITALALSATLALGAAPAFAAEGGVDVGGAGSVTPTEDAAGKASTELKVYASASKVQATIPISVTIVTPQLGGIITAPSADAYKIINNNAEEALQVTSVQGVKSAGWAVKANLSEAAIAGTNEIKLSIKAGSANPVVLTETAQDIKGINATHFTAPKQGSLGLELAGETRVTSDALTSGETYPAMNIVYTVGSVAAATVS